MREFILLELTPLECTLLLETIDYRFNEADRRNQSGIPSDRKSRKGKFLILATVREQLIKAQEAAQ